MRKNSEHKATKTSKDRKDRHQDVMPSKMKIGKKSNFNIFLQFEKGRQLQKMLSLCQNYLGYQTDSFERNH